MQSPELIFTYRIVAMPVDWCPQNREDAREYLTKLISGELPSIFRQPWRRSKEANRKPYKREIERNSKERWSSLIMVRGNSIEACYAAQNIRNEQTSFLGMGVTFVRVPGKVECWGLTYPLTEVEQREAMERKSYQDRQEKKAKPLQAKVGLVPKGHYRWAGNKRVGGKRTHNLSTVAVVH